MLLHLALLALAVFCIWEAARALVPDMPDALVAAWLFAIAFGLDKYVPDRYLGLLAVVAVVGVLHQKFGSSASATYALRLPSRKRSRVSLP